MVTYGITTALVAWHAVVDLLYQRVHKDVRACRMMTATVKAKNEPEIYFLHFHIFTVLDTNDIICLIIFMSSKFISTWPSLKHVEQRIQPLSLDAVPTECWTYSKPPVPVIIIT